MKVDLKADSNVNQIVVTELLERRSELQVATSNLYLRGTVLAALSASQAIALMNLPIAKVPKVWLFGSLIIAFILGLLTFWPRRKSQYTIELLRDYLSEHGKFSSLGYQKYLSEDYDQERVKINRLNWLIVVGFCISGLSFVPMFILSLEVLN